MQFREDLQEDGSSHFLKLKDKEKVKGVFAGDVYDFRQHWVKTERVNKSEMCMGHGCQYCAHGDRPQFRFRINFIIFDEKTNQPFVKIFEQGVNVYKQLRELNREFPLNNYIVKITRSGSTRQDTEYSVIPSPSPLTQNIKQLIATVKLHDLVSGGEPIADEPSGFNDF